MNKKKQLIYYIALISAFVTTQAPFWVARKATAAAAISTVKKTATKKTTATAINGKAKSTATKTAAKKTKATAVNGKAKSTAKKTAGKKTKATAKNGTAKSIAKKRATAKAIKPYKVTSCTRCTFDEDRKVLVCEQGQGMKLELPVKIRKLTGNPMNYLAKLPKRKTGLCGLPVPKKGEKLGDGKLGAPQQCGLVIDESRLKEASLVMPKKLESLKPTVKKTTK